VLDHPNVQDCGVIGLPDDKWGERVTAVVQLRPGMPLTGGELTSFVMGRLAVPHSQTRCEIADTGGDLAGFVAVKSRQGTQRGDQAATTRDGVTLAWLTDGIVLVH
jgi:acyl-CoA synthetase (AMP-forming)/AMP-acid ligase II